jgi:hypothetical protein
MLDRAMAEKRIEFSPTKPPGVAAMAASKSRATCLDMQIDVCLDMADSKGTPMNIAAGTRSGCA